MPQQPKKAPDPVGLRLVKNVEAGISLRGWTDRQLAEAAQIKQPQMSMLLNGTRGFTTATIAKIAAAFTVDPSVLVCPPSVAYSLLEPKENALPSTATGGEDVTYLSDTHREIGGGVFHGTGQDDGTQTRLTRLEELAQRYEDALATLASVSEQVTERTAAILAASDKQQRETARVLKAIKSRIPRRSDPETGGQTGAR